MSGRRNEISLILRQLESCRAAAISMNHTYALDETIRLVESLTSAGTYMRWLACHLPQLKADHLLELNELLPEWDGPIHDKLLEIERDRWPRFILPLVNRLLREITSAGRPMTVMDLGSGSMEIGRQVLSQLLAQRDVPAVTFIAVDESSSAHELAVRNLASLAGRVDVSDAPLEKAISLSREPASRPRVLLCRAGAASIASLPHGAVDLLFHSFLRHHLTASEQAALDAATSRIARTTIEYDGYYSRRFLIPLSILTWKEPAFLAASLFSHARFPTKHHLKAKHNGSLKFFQNGCYLAAR